jgi:GNAT superfamily N-acetyltransferase
MPRVAAVRTYLELPDPGTLKRAPAPAAAARVEAVAEVPPELARRLYVEVGSAYHWRDRLGWTDAQWRERFALPAVSLHLLSVAGTTAGYFELQKHGDGSVEIAYFGLLPAFHGRGLGKFLLTDAADAAWALGATRVWLHTCTLDDPAALPNYVARGFRPYREERYEADLPD